MLVTKSEIYYALLWDGSPEAKDALTNMGIGMLDKNTGFIFTDQGKVVIHKGDWVLQGKVSGSIESISPETFQKDYVQVPNDL
jgi:hypothetical protein